MSTPVGAVQGQNAHKGVKRSVQGNPVGVPRQLPGFRGRSVDAGGPVKAPKLRNGNNNNEISNVRIPYNVVCPLEFLSSYQGRLGPGDLCFRYRYPPGFTKSQSTALNTTLGVNTLSRVVGLDGLNRLLMGSGPNGWRLGENVYEVPDNKLEDGAYGVLSSKTGVFALTTLNEYPLQGIVISNDEPGAFTSNGNRDNAIFNLAIQGPTETNNGFLMYENPTKATANLYNPLTGVTNLRTVEAHARGSAESGMHIEGTHMPGRVGSDFQNSRGKVDFVANFCGTYAMYPSQMFDRRVESMNTLYVGLRAYELSVAAKRQLTTSMGEKRFADSDSDVVLESKKLYFYQFLPFSSRVAHVIQAVTNKHEEVVRDTIAAANDVDAATIPAGAVKAYMQRPEEAEKGRINAAKKVGAIKQQTETSLPSAHFDTATYDPIRSKDLFAMVGAYQVGRVLDTKAAVHERYAGGPRDTAFSCIVDVQVGWRAALPVQISPDSKAPSTGFLLDPSERTERGGQQSATTLANNLTPALTRTIGPDFGRDVTPATTTSKSLDDYRAFKLNRQQQMRAENERLSRLARVRKAQKEKVVEKLPDASAQVKRAVDENKDRVLLSELVGVNQYGRNPMDTIRQLIQIEGVTYTDPETNSSDAWRAFQELRNKCPTEAQRQDERLVEVYKTNLVIAKSQWQNAAKNEIVTLMQSADPKLGLGLNTNTPQIKKLKRALKGKLKAYVTALNIFQAKVTVAMESADDTMAAAVANEASPMLNRANIFLVLFHEVMTRLGDRTGQETFKLKTCVEDIEQALEDGALLDETVHLLELCDLHEMHFPVHDTLFSLAPAAAAAAPAAAPHGLAATAAAAAAPKGATEARAPSVASAAAAATTRTGATAGAKAPTKGRGKSPAKPRPGTAMATGASAAAAAASAPVAPAPAVAAATGVPAAAAGMSSTPLVPTQTGAASDAAVPRRRAREAAGGSESVTNSLFENMFKPAGTDASAEEQHPASPTPSSGSEGPSAGPRTFRRQR